MSSEQDDDPGGRRGPSAAARIRARAVLALVPDHRRGHRLQHHRADLRAAVPQGRRPGRRRAPSRSASSRARSSSRPRTSSGRPTARPRRRPAQLIVFYPSISSTILTMWIVMAIVLDRLDPDGPRLEAHPGPRPERVRVVLRVPERLRPRHRRPDGASRTSRSSPRSSCSSCSATGAGSSRRSGGSTSCGRRRATSTSPSGSPW